jgi:hypothetical protein
MPVGDGATFRFIVEDALSGGSSGGGSSGGGTGGSDKSPDNPNPKGQIELVKNLSTAAEKGTTSALKTLGIQLTLSNLLKQSQVFTGIVSSIFQVLGAVLDVALAPLLPFLAKVLKDYFPALLRFSESISNFLSGELAKFEELGLGGYIADVFTRLGDFMIDLIPNLLSSIASAIRSWFGDSEAGKIIDGFTEGIKSAFTNLGEWIDSWLPGPAIFNTSDVSGNEGGSGGPSGLSDKTNFAGVGGMIEGIVTGVDDTIAGVKKAFGKTGIFGKAVAGLGKVATTAAKEIVPLSGTAKSVSKFGMGFLKKAMAPIGVAMDAVEIGNVIQEHGFTKGMQLLGIKGASYAAGTLVGAGITAAGFGASAPVGIVAGGATAVVTEKLLRRMTGFDASLEVKIDTGGPTENTMMVANDKQKNQIAATIHSDSSMYTGGM